MNSFFFKMKKAIHTILLQDGSNVVVYSMSTDRHKNLQMKSYYATKDKLYEEGYNYKNILQL